MWLDASAQEAARQSLHLPPLRLNGSVDFMFDGSGRARHLAAPTLPARPRFRRDSQTAFLSFDGTGNALSACFLRGELTNATVFIVAAPRSNRGEFRAFFSFNRAGANDYSTGFNLDLGAEPSADLSFINAEGAGMSGVKQLLQGPPLDFGPWRLLTLHSEPGAGLVRLFLDGRAVGARPRGAEPMWLNDFTLGARHYSNSGEPPFTQDYFDGDIAEFLLYSRPLTDPERASVEQYLRDKYSALFQPADRPADAAALQPAPQEIPGAPPPRPRAEIEALLKAAGADQAPGEPFNIVLCAGPKDHGPGEHDYPLWQKRWAKLLAAAPKVEVATAWEWPSAEQFQAAQVVVFYSDNPDWNEQRGAELDAALARGCGLVFIHFAVDGHDDAPALARRIGLAWRGGTSKFRHGPIDLKLEPGPLTAGLGPLHLVDESYWNLIGDEHDCQVVASAVEDGAARPLVWTRTQDKGRVFVCIPGHFTWTFDDPLFRLLCLRGISWAGGQPPDRLSNLALPGARIQD
jgi:type 1 glutamine amidotransferase